MCDTLLRMRPEGPLFGKNSDRSPNEPNLVLFAPAGKPAEKTVKCTYREIPQVSATHAVLLVKPSWMWGAEMGVNDKGLLIGNEAVFTHGSDKKTERLTGMDLLRLALERAEDVHSALETILGLLETHGQGGNCGFDKSFFYDNSFLLADRREAVILETCGKRWVAKRVEGAGNISNRLSLAGDFTLSSSEDNAGFARKFSEPVFTLFSRSAERSRRAALGLKKDPLGAKEMVALLQSHRIGDSRSLYAKGDVGSLCMHKSLLGDHTTGSFVADFGAPFDTFWIPGSSTPCLSVFKPVYFGNALPPVFADPKKSLEYWLQREWLIRAVYAGFVDESAYRTEIAELQERFFKGNAELKRMKPTPAQLQDFSRKCHFEEQAMVNRHLEEIKKLKENPGALPSLWKAPTARLGKNVFAPDLASRMAK